tara:strand:- start:1876 stop:2880 length:1005 start_codon:yes stop_codon:yes gene_type:complete
MINFKRLIQKFSFGYTQKEDIDDSKFSQSKFWSSTLIFSIVGSLSFALAYAFLVKIDEVVTGRGELQALGAERPIKSNISGKISNIYVEEGEKVKKGQLLISLNDDALKAKLSGLQKEKEYIIKVLKIEKEVLDRSKKIYDSGAISFLEVLKLEKRVLEINSSLYKTQSEIDLILVALKDLKIISPLDGNIFDLIPKSSGYFTNAGETLLKIVPEGTLEAKIFINNSDIGFVKKGMNAEIRIDAFPFSRFGSIDGIVKNIGEEVIPADNMNPQSRFPVYVDLKKQSLFNKDKEHDIKSGQSISVNLIVKKRRIITLFTDIFSNSIDSLKSIKSP